ncbi:MAG: GxxExxY protein [Candidatus Brocadia sp.]|nr:GxxExxY protein [Candidatus Brocadia sp.]
MDYKSFETTDFTDYTDKEHKLQKYYVPDFIVYNEVLVEIKAEHSLLKVDEAQLINSLIISHHSTGLLINFGEESLRYRRFKN